MRKLTSRMMTAVAVLGIGAATIVATAAPAAADSRAWNCWKETVADGNPNATQPAFELGCETTSGTGYFLARWHRYGDNLELQDHYPNGHMTMSLVNNDAGNFVKRTNKHSQTFDFGNLREGSKVVFMVCSSSEANRQCSDRVTINT